MCYKPKCFFLMWSLMRQLEVNLLETGGGEVALKSFSAGCSTFYLLRIDLKGFVHVCSADVAYHLNFYTFVCSR